MGRAEILLKELIESEIVGASLNAKTPLIQRWANVYPLAFAGVKPESSAIMDENMAPLGTIKYKMRLRKPIQQAMRYFKEQTEVRNIEKFVSLDPKLGSVKPAKKLVTITIKGAKGLKTAYSDTVTMSPFFFYQFYTFDDRYSQTSSGANPEFNDTYSYEVLVDSKAIGYFETEPLQVILFDDSAPIAGVGLDDAQSAAQDDMIGICKIPIDNLASGCSMHDRFPILNAVSNKNCGDLEVRIDIMDLE